MPNLNVAGWWDQEDFDGPMKIYEMMEKNDTDHKNYLVVGPWNHGGWAYGEGNKLGNVEFGNSTARYFREKIQAPWFAYWLKDKGKLPVEEAVTYETGANRVEIVWCVAAEGWDFEIAKLYFRDSGKISFDPPAACGRGIRFVHFRSGESGAVSSPAGGGDVWAREPVVYVAAGRSAICGSPAGYDVVVNGAAGVRM